MKMSSKKTNYVEKFRTMTFTDIRKFLKDNVKDWEQPNGPERDKAIWPALEASAEREFPKLNLMQLIEIWQSLEEGEYESVGTLCHDYMKRQEPICSIVENIDEHKKLINRF